MRRREDGFNFEISEDGGGTLFHSDVGAMTREWPLHIIFFPHPRVISASSVVDDVVYGFLL
jgi:hypothetical protein